MAVLLVPDYVSGNSRLFGLLADGVVRLPNLWIGSLIPPGEEVYSLIKHSVVYLVADQAVLARGEPGSK